ncbi:thiamine-phosphate pyrophosphorylase [Malonomonas rubra DSM 5091]|uniref:Thiamine-phosphate synthase n=1 Tax=Malonomonas rubra DSM 5091 TaxID=1122189 RepID=A0A1M6IV26_MALRU|nr:thiamine phosphate synthase [Malonomonas rubra]SHJ38270.1 thiamine-phosphate pyrophosphorylase [Malonomonas rubra DSM 5091]
MKPLDLSLHLVTDRNLSLGRDLLDIVQAAVQGGVSVVQLREKECATREFVELGRAVSSLLQQSSVPLLINDRVDIALAIGADGVHIGQSDMPYADARRLLGTDAIIGLSVESEAHAQAAEILDVDYLGLSPVFTTPTKCELTESLGLEGVASIRRLSRHRLVAIGGIHHENISAILKSGADGVAVVSAICSASDPLQATRQLQQKIAV